MIPPRQQITTLISVSDEDRTRSSTPRRLLVSMGSSIASHGVALLIVLGLPLFLPSDVPKIRGYQVTPLISTQLTLPTPPKLNAALRPPPIALPEPAMIASRALHFDAPAPRKEVSQPKDRLDVPELKSNIPNPAVNEMLPSSAKQPPQPVELGSFAEASLERSTANQSKSSVHTGEFGDPAGAKANSDLPARLSLPRVGSFDISSGADGSGGGRQGGAVSKAGFESAGAAISGRGGGTRTGVRGAGFQETDQPTAKTNSQVKTSAATTRPVEILYKAVPAYSREARDLKLEGDVLLNVRFGLNGTIQVIGVKKGLGHGLDEAAISAAEAIRFKPALRDGQPVDFDAIVHIEFRLAY